MIKCIGKIIVVLLIIVALLILTVFVVRYKNKRKLNTATKNGIYEKTFISLGGQQQYIEILGNDQSNPVIIFLHGGPGFPLTYLSYYFQKDLLYDYTIVNWEQRGCGKTYYKNTSDISVDILLSDLDELVSYTKTRFKCEKVILMGQSWGSVLGSVYTKNNPQNVSAYIGVGQVIDFDYGKVFSATKAINHLDIEPQDKDQLVNSINIFDKHKSIEEVDVDNLEKLIIGSLEYLKGEQENSGLKTMLLGIFSPDMNIQDIKWFLNASSTKAILELERMLVDYMYYGFDVNDLGYNYDVPIYYIQGTNDYITPTELVRGYYENINAPKKQMILIDQAGHTPFLDKPDEFYKAVISILK